MHWFVGRHFFYGGVCLNKKYKKGEHTAELLRSGSHLISLEETYSVKHEENKKMEKGYGAKLHWLTNDCAWSAADK